VRSRAETLPPSWQPGLSLPHLMATASSKGKWDDLVAPVLEGGQTARPQSRSTLHLVSSPRVTKVMHSRVSGQSGAERVGQSGTQNG
jgi:hypothetical protein